MVFPNNLCIKLYKLNFRKFTTMWKGLFLIYLLYAQVAFAQELSYSEYKKQVSVESIQNLANGALLVRLKTRQKTVDKLKEFGRISDAEKLQKEVEEKNRLIREAFEKEYDFSPVYFFDAKFAHDLRSGDLDSVTFINAQGTIVRPQLNNYLIAAFATTQPDTASFFRGYRQVVSENGVKQKSTYYADKNMGLPALIIYSPEMIQLTDPFPYYVRTFESLPFKRSMPKTVKKMNKKLYSYYRQNKYR